MKKLVLALALLGLLVAGQGAHAIIPATDDVPAATLLLPYFEVDLANAQGVTTLFSINNASATAVLAHVTLWSDLSVPVLDFNVYLTGYDVQTINMRDIINGILPRTASAAQDTGEAEPDPAPTPTAISNQGTFSQDITFASCAGQLPPPAVLPQLFIDHMRNSLTGQASTILNGLCAGQRLNDNIARGYVTVDTVNNCTLQFPPDAGYFLAGGLGSATNQNVLWGDYFYVNSAQNFAQGETLVHIEASATDPQTSVPGQYTFYGRYSAWAAIDNREPLATNFAVRYIQGGIFDGGTDLLCWRDSRSTASLGGFTCPATTGRPVWFPLGQEQVVIFDEQENPDVPSSTPVSPQPPGASLRVCPAEAQRTAVGGSALPVPFSFGWLFLNLNHNAGTPVPEDPLAAQAWVTAVMDANGRFSVGFDAVRLDSAAGPVNHSLIGGGGAPAGSSN